MDLTAFLQTYDQPGAVVLLEGKRKVNPEDSLFLVQLGELLARSSRHMRFRSGNATGSDELFSRGVSQVDYQRLEVITPYEGHRKRDNFAYTTVSLDQIDLAEEPEVMYHSRTHRSMEKLVDQFAAGEKNPATIKAAYIIRDTVKVTGTRGGVAPATVALFYDDLAAPQSGGTGHTMRVCEQNNIPLFDQRIWMAWLAQG